MTTLPKCRCDPPVAMGNLVSKRTFFSWENAPEITGRFSMEKGNGCYLDVNDEF